MVNPRRDESISQFVGVLNHSDVLPGCYGQPNYVAAVVLLVYSNAIQDSLCVSVFVYYIESY